MMRRRSTPFLALMAVIAACAVNPATGEYEFMLVSESQEIAMGREADPEVAASMGLVEDPELQAYVSDLGSRLAAISERPQLPWSFKVVDDPVVNAFALPGGFIYVTRGILAHFEDEAELAGVLGHEIAHVTARHSASQMSRQQLQQIGLGVGMIFSETVREYSGLASAGLQLLNLSYSRGDESEADRIGLTYMARQGYDPDAMIGMFQMLAQVGGGGDGRVPEWQSTHPYPENRESDIRRSIAEGGYSAGGIVNRDAYLDHIDGLVYGPNPREGFFQGPRFLHPDLAFELTFPAGWTTVNQRQVVGGIAPAEDAVLVLGLVEGAGEPAAELREFLAQDGVRGGTIREDGSADVERVRADFEVTTQDGVLRGEMAFVRYGGLVYRLLGYALSSRWSAYSAAVASSISSFRAVTDPAVLGVQPMRLQIVTLPGAMSLDTYVGRNPGPLDAADLAVLNRTQPAAVLSAGRRIKTVVGEPLPQ